MASTRPPWTSSVVFSDEKNIKTQEVLQLALKEVTHLWWQLGLELGHLPGSLDKIKSNPEKGQVKDKFRDMLEHWLNEGEDEYRTWGALAKAVDRAGNKALGKKVRKLPHYQESSRVEFDLKDLAAFLKSLTADWKTFSTYLGIDLDVVDQIEYKLKVDDCFRNMIKKWITDPDDDKEPTLEVLCKALESHAVANRALAIKILKDIEVLQLLVVSEEAKDKEDVEKQLKEHIKILQDHARAIETDVADLPEPPTKTPGADSATSKKEKVLEESK